MATYVTYSPVSLIDKAMFNFDAFGLSDFKLAGTIRVSTSDNFSYADYTSVSYSNFWDALYTSPQYSGEAPWSAQTSANLQEILGIYQQFAGMKFAWVGDFDVAGTDSTPNPEDIGRANLSDINITWTYRSDGGYGGVSGIGTDNQFRYVGGAGDIFLNAAAPVFGGDFSLDLNTRGRQILMHELGHSLGLSHPHTSYVNGVATLSTDYAALVSAGFQELGFNIRTAADMNKEYFTIMSYDDQLSLLPGSSYVWNAHTPMILDVIALQAAYGEGAGTSGTGDDTIFAGTAGYRTYFDKGGVDTIDMSHYTEGAYLNMGTGISGAPHLVGVGMSLVDASSTILAGGNPAHLRWFYGEFENAKGSAWADLLVGNSLNNNIEGGAGDDFLLGKDGNDSLAGGPGNDELDGGAGNDVFDWDGAMRGGNDTFIGGPGDDVYVLDSVLDSIVENPSEGIDTVNVGFSYSLVGTFLENISTFSNQILGLTFIGNEWGNHIRGGGGTDVLRGNEGNDTIRGSGGYDTVDGGTGYDTAEYSGSVKGYSVVKTSDSYVVTDRVSGRDGTDAVANIEKLDFSDYAVNLTIQASANLIPAAALSRVMELYVAFFNRVPDADGLEYWLGQVKAGASINWTADAFYSAGVHYSALTGFSANMSNQDFVNVVYRNVLGRTEGADAGGLAFWSGKLGNGEATRGSLVSAILDSAHTFKGSSTYGWVADLLDNKLAVAHTVAVEWGLNWHTPESSIANGMAIAAAVTPTDTAVAIGLVGIEPGSFLLV